jgi:hypothetical protein
MSTQTEQLQLSGKVLQILEAKSGTSTRGPWSKQEFLMETLGQYPKKILFTSFGEIVGRVSALQINDQVKVLFNLHTTEKDSKYYTNATAYRIEVIGKENIKGKVSQEESDDLPF